jgi:hypothetical protein
VSAYAYGDGPIGLVLKPLPDLSTILDLTGGATTSGQVVLPFAGRVLANASVDLINNAAATARSGCTLFISDGTGPANGFTAMGARVFADHTATNLEHRVVALVGAASKPAGTYNVAVRCYSVSGNVSGYAASVTVIASPS